jgi:hypothetical protein
MRNNFAYRNFLRFLLDVEKNQRTFYELKSKKNSLEILKTLDFYEI